MGVSFSDLPFEILDWPVALNQMIKSRYIEKNSSVYQHHMQALDYPKNDLNRGRNTASKEKSNYQKEY